MDLAGTGISQALAGSSHPSPARCIVYVIMVQDVRAAYVGETQRPYPERLRQHLSSLRHGSHPTRLLQWMWDVWGEEAFSYAILEELDGPHLLRRREAYWMVEMTREGWRVLNARQSGQHGDEPAKMRDEPRQLPAPPSEPVAPDGAVWVSVPEAARLLKTSPQSVRRRIKAGTLIYEEVERPQGAYKLVQLPANLVVDSLSASPLNEVDVAAEPDPWEDAQAPPEPEPEPEAAPAGPDSIMLSLLARVDQWTTRALEQAEQLGDLKGQLAVERDGRARAEAEHLALQSERDGLLLALAVALAPRSPGAGQEAAPESGVAVDSGASPAAPDTVLRRGEAKRGPTVRVGRWDRVRYWLGL